MTLRLGRSFCLEVDCTWIHIVENTCKLSWSFLLRRSLGSLGRLGWLLHLLHHRSLWLVTAHHVLHLSHHWVHLHLHLLHLHCLLHIWIAILSLSLYWHILHWHILYNTVLISKTLLPLCSREFFKRGVWVRRNPSSRNKAATREVSKQILEFNYRCAGKIWFDSTEWEGFSLGISSLRIYIYIYI